MEKTPVESVAHEPLALLCLRVDKATACSDARTGIYCCYHSHRKVPGARMKREQRFVTSTGVRGDTMQHVTARRLLSSVLIGLCITLIFTLLEIGILWLLNPLHLTGNTQQRFSAMLALPAHSPQWLLLPLGELAVASLAAAVAARPLALMAYLRDVHQAQEEYHKLYTPLTALANIRKTAEVTQEDITTPTIYMREEQVSILDLVQQQDTHMLILGVPGAGKTMALRVFQ